MQPLDAVYLQILKNLCTDLSEPVPLDGVDPSALYRLAEKHCSLPFLLPYFEQQPQFSALKQQTKQMLLSYYQLEHFTRLTFSLLLAEKIPCFLLKRRAITMSPTASLFPRLAAPLRWNSITASSVFISFPGPMNWWTKFFPPVI